MAHISWLLLFAILCLCAFLTRCTGNLIRSRLTSINESDGFLKAYWKFFAEGFRLLIHDYFGVHCPWSWKRAKRYRLADMRTFLGESGRPHELLGHISVADCDNPEKQEVIARKTYVSRTTYWLDGVSSIPLMAVFGLFIFVIIHMIGGILILGARLIGKEV